MKKKRVKQELRALGERNAELEETQRLLATHAEVIALAVRSPDHVPEQDLDDAIAGLNALGERRRSGTTPSVRGSQSRPEPVTAPTE